jgi:hypothetical protein
MSGLEICAKCVLFVGLACGGKSPLQLDKHEPKPSKKWQQPELHKVDERPQEPWQAEPNEEDDKEADGKEDKQVDAKAPEP